MNQRIHVITKLPCGTVSIKNPDRELMMLRMIANGLKHETPMMRLSAKIPRATTLARRIGFKGNKEKQLAQVEARIILRCMEIQEHNASIPE